MNEASPEILNSVSSWHFAIGGLQTDTETIELSRVIRLQRLTSFPSQDDLSTKLNSPFVAGIVGHYGEERLTHQLVVESASSNFEFICDSVRAILAGLRVRTQSELFSPVVCSHRWDDLPDSSCVAARFEPHVYSLDLGEPTLIDQSDLDWVKRNLGKVLELNKQTRFNIALDALCSYLHTERDRMKAAQLWVGIEAIFEVQFEISYRLPLLAALMLQPRGEDCKLLRNRIKKLYSQRSKAIHGQEFKDAKQHVTDVRQLLASLLSKIIEGGHLPSKKDFDDLVLMPEENSNG